MHLDANRFAAIVALITLAVTVPSTMFAIHEYRGRCQLQPRVTLSSPIEISIINVGRYPARLQAFDIRISDGAKTVWSGSGLIDYLEPGAPSFIRSDSLLFVTPARFSPEATVSFS